MSGWFDPQLLSQEWHGYFMGPFGPKVDGVWAMYGCIHTVLEDL